MTIAFILILFALLALVFLFRLVRGNGIVLSSDNLAQSIRPIDLPAFRNLIDSGEEDYLRRHLSSADFRTVHRERLLAAVDYISGAAHNAAVLLRLGDIARHSSDPSIADAGEKLVNNALQLRWHAFLAIGRLYIAIWFPQMQLGVSGVTDNYENMTRLVVLLGCLRFPTEGVASAL